MMEVTVFRMNDHDFMASHLDVEETNHFYNEMYGCDNDVEDVEELNIDTDTMWYIVTDNVDKNCITVDGKNYKISGSDVFKNVTLKEALEMNGEYEEPYVIATTEY